MQQINFLASCHTGTEIICAAAPPPLHNHEPYAAPALDHACLDCRDDGNVHNGEVDDELSLGLSLAPGSRSKPRARTKCFGSSEQLCVDDDHITPAPVTRVEDSTSSQDYVLRDYLDPACRRAELPSITDDQLYCDALTGSRSDTRIRDMISLQTVGDQDMGMLPQAGIYPPSRDHDIGSLIPQHGRLISNGPAVSLPPQTVDYMIDGRSTPPHLQTQQAWACSQPLEPSTSLQHFPDPYLVHIQQLNKRELQAQRRQEARNRRKCILELKQQTVRSKDGYALILQGHDPSCSFTVHDTTGNPSSTNSVQHLAPDKMHRTDCYKLSEEFRGHAHPSKKHGRYSSHKSIKAPARAKNRRRSKKLLCEEGTRSLGFAKECPDTQLAETMSVSLGSENVEKLGHKGVLCHVQTDPTAGSLRAAHTASPSTCSSSVLESPAWQVCSSKHANLVDLNTDIHHDFNLEKDDHNNCEHNSVKSKACHTSCERAGGAAAIHEQFDNVQHEDSSQKLALDMPSSFTPHDTLRLPDVVTPQSGFSFPCLMRHRALEQEKEEIQLSGPSSHPPAATLCQSLSVDPGFGHHRAQQVSLPNRPFSFFRHPHADEHADHYLGCNPSRKGRMYNADTDMSEISAKQPGLGEAILQHAEGPITSAATECAFPAQAGEFPFQGGGMDLEPTKVDNCITPCSTQADQLVRDRNRMERPDHEDTTRAAILNGPSTSKSSQICEAVSSLGRNGLKTYKNLPWVSTTGMGPLGKTVRGLMFLETGTKNVQLICSCHGKNMSPVEFVQHSGSSNIANPEKSIVVSAIPPRNAAAAQFPM